MFAPSDVIIAIASPPGHAPRGIVRLSGERTFELLAAHLALPQTGSNAHSPVRGAQFVRFQAQAFDLPAIALFMPGPHSYTGEHSAELQFPGNPVLLQRVVDLMIDSAKQRSIPTRRAYPGEFTGRAFLNGRLSLTQAEGVAATIAAQSDAELRAAHILSSGALGKFAHELANELANALALVEAGIDFTDQEDVVAISPADLHARLVALHRRIEDQVQRSVGMEQLQAIPWVVLVGHPNAGKSALFNALLGHERAVVSPTSGTTRDVLAEPLAISTPHGLAEVMLVDLAGIDEDVGAMNQLMQSAARQAIERAELILRCVAIDQEVSSHDPREVIVRTKSDLARSAESTGRDESDEIFVSAFARSGLEELKSRIAARLANRAISLAADAIALQPRHESSLRSCHANLSESIGLVAPVRQERSLAYPELIASTMRAALDDMAALAGDISPDEVLGRVFATFCVGK